MNRIFIIFIFASLAWTGYGQSQTTRLHTFNLEAPQLDTIRSISVYLPSQYELNEKQRYPVLYLQDAQNLFDDATSYAGEWKVDETIDSLDLQLIVVGISHGEGKRIDELTPYPHPEYGGGKADAYLDFLSREVKPYIDSHFRTLPDREHTWIGGSSLGGLLSFYTMFEQAPLFSAGIVFSPSFWFNDKIFELPQKTGIPEDLLIYMASGTEEEESTGINQSRMKGILLRSGMNPDHLRSEMITGAAHNEAFWSKEFPKAISWLWNKKISSGH
ncbi:alpha/beta hydrolase [Robertkochia aurantiaca]|uniref:alpha/beta hydrolase n=1 Tax=Robertkochia aurantiaca TaxID=2873700 RepID=UPI001CCBFF72|nr:alpha/beta hydrolase-fold protein [Robertkochia sp. 3YJGBD-33]